MEGVTTAHENHLPAWGAPPTALRGEGGKEGGGRRRKEKGGKRSRREEQRDKTVRSSKKGGKGEKRGAGR